MVLLKKVHISLILNQRTATPSDNPHNMPVSKLNGQPCAAHLGSIEMGGCPNVETPTHVTTRAGSGARYTQYSRLRGRRKNITRAWTGSPGVSRLRWFATRIKNRSPTRVLAREERTYSILSVKLYLLIILFARCTLYTSTRAAAVLRPKYSSSLDGLWLVLLHTLHKSTTLFCDGV